MIRNPCKDASVYVRLGHATVIWGNIWNLTPVKSNLLCRRKLINSCVTDCTSWGRESLSSSPWGTCPANTEKKQRPQSPELCLCGCHFASSTNLLEDADIYTVVSLKRVTGSHLNATSEKNYTVSRVQYQNQELSEMWRKLARVKATRNSQRPTWALIGRACPH